MTEEEWRQGRRLKGNEWHNYFCFFIVSAAAHSLWEAYDGYVSLYLSKQGLTEYDLCKHGDTEYWKNETGRLGKWLNTQISTTEAKDLFNENGVPNYYLLFTLYKSGSCKMDKLWYVFSKYVIANKVYHILRDSNTTSAFGKQDVLSAIGLSSDQMEEPQSYVRDASILLRNIFSEKGDSLIEKVEWLSFIKYFEDEDLYNLAKYVVLQDKNDEVDSSGFYWTFKDIATAQDSDYAKQVRSASRLALDRYNPSTFNSNNLTDIRNYFMQSTMEMQDEDAYYALPQQTADKPGGDESAGEECGPVEGKPSADEKTPKEKDDDGLSQKDYILINEIAHCFTDSDIKVQKAGATELVKQIKDCYNNKDNSRKRNPGIVDIVVKFLRDKRIYNGSEYWKEMGQHLKSAGYYEATDSTWDTTVRDKKDRYRIKATNK